MLGAFRELVFPRLRDAVFFVVLAAGRARAVCFTSFDTPGPRTTRTVVVVRVDVIIRAFLACLVLEPELGTDRFRARLRRDAI